MAGRNSDQLGQALYASQRAIKRNALISMVLSTVLIAAGIAQATSRDGGIVVLIIGVVIFLVGAAGLVVPRRNASRSALPDMSADEPSA